MSKKEATKMKPINYARLTRQLMKENQEAGVRGEFLGAATNSAMLEIVSARAEGKTGFADRVDVILAGLLGDAG